MIKIENSEVDCELNGIIIKIKNIVIECDYYHNLINRNSEIYLFNNKINIPNSDIIIDMINHIRNKSKFDFDCACFVFYYKSIPYIFGSVTNELVKNYFILSDFLNPKVGDVILMSKNNNIVHFAIYLGNNNYLSKLGSGAIVVTTIDMLEKGYLSTDLKIISKI